MNHIEIYFARFGEDRICELTGKPGGDIHHIEARGMGGRKSVDYIENLMCLCREAHEFFGDKKQYKDWLMTIHLEYMEDQTPLYQKRIDNNLLIFMGELGKVRFLM